MHHLVTHMYASYMSTRVLVNNSKSYCVGIWTNGAGLSPLPVFTLPRVRDLYNVFVMSYVVTELYSTYCAITPQTMGHAMLVLVTL